jgi:hypothetical protein
MRKQQISRDYRVAAFARLSDHPTDTEHGLIDQIIDDVRRALEARDGVATIGLAALGAELRFQGATPGYHEDGGQLVGAALQYQLVFHPGVTRLITPWSYSHAFRKRRIIEIRSRAKPPWPCPP